MKKFISIIVLIILGSSASLSQDTTQVLGLSDFLKIVRDFHPLGKQANLRIEYGTENLKSSKGAFDPYLYGDIYQKYFDDKQYYDLLNAGMKIPTWFGIEIDAGYEQSDGNYVNPQRGTPANGLVYAGISIPIGQDLFMDQRRADLRKAQVYQEITQAEQQILINNLFKDAISAYWDWVSASRKLSIYQEGQILALTRYRALTRSAIVGESPAIDTLEAYIQYQNRTINLQDAILDYRNANAQLEIYLWNQDGIPLELSANISPPRTNDFESSMDVGAMRIRLDSLLKNHPKMAKNQLYLEQLNIQRKLDLERLKPKLDLKYNALNEPLNGDLIQGYSINNYNWGLTFKMPIFLRKERGQLQKTNIDIMEQQYNLDQMERSINLNVTAAMNTWETTQQQLLGYSDIVTSTNRLLQAEQQKFNAGESSLFLVNSREWSYISTQVKFVDLLIKSQKAFMKIEYELGRLN
ncbi:TolC family protein [Brumimicrobium mesophilum]|uniref:TolC family protein n=1 Tax=Brumimicrobium mesophilum TaxID=392717 RepID=UPI000D143657|nr:TolC family protein [Brumimicrobium mesophilum]